MSQTVTRGDLCLIQDNEAQNEDLMLTKITVSKVLSAKRTRKSKDEYSNDKEPTTVTHSPEVKQEIEKRRRILEARKQRLMKAKTEGSVATSPYTPTRIPMFVGRKTSKRLSSAGSSNLRIYTTNSHERIQYQNTKFSRKD